MKTDYHKIPELNVVDGENLEEHEERLKEAKYGEMRA